MKINGNMEHSAQYNSKIAFAKKKTILTRNRVLVILQLFWTEGKVIFIILLILLSGWLLNVILQTNIFWALSGAQGVTIFICLAQVRHHSLLGLSQVSLNSLSFAYFVGQTKHKISTLSCIFYRKF